jgi:hypothetical protein
MSDKPYAMMFVNPDGNIVLEYIHVLPKSKSSKMYRCEINNDDKIISKHFDGNVSKFMDMIYAGKEAKFFILIGKNKCECYIEKYKTSYMMDLIDTRHICHLKNNDIDEISMHYKLDIKKLKKRTREFEEHCNILGEKKDTFEQKNKTIKKNIIELRQDINTTQEMFEKVADKYNTKKMKNQKLKEKNQKLKENNQKLKDELIIVNNMNESLRHEIHCINTNNYKKV